MTNEDLREAFWKDWAIDLGSEVYHHAIPDWFLARCTPKEVVRQEVIAMLKQLKETPSDIDTLLAIIENVK